MEKLFVGDGEVKVEGDVIDLETRLSVIQALIPLGLEAVADLLSRRWSSSQAFGMRAKVRSRRIVGGEARRDPCI